MKRIKTPSPDSGMGMTLMAIAAMLMLAWSVGRVL